MLFRAIVKNGVIHNPQVKFDPWEKEAISHQPGLIPDEVTLKIDQWYTAPWVYECIATLTPLTQDGLYTLYRDADSAQLVHRWHAGSKMQVPLDFAPSSACA